MLKRLLAAFVLLSVLGASGTYADATGSPALAGPTVIDWKLTPSDITTSCKGTIDDAKAAIAQLVAQTAPPTFKNTVLLLENLNADLNDRLVAQTFLWDVSPEKSVRDASFACSNDVSAFDSNATANPAIYKALAGVSAASLTSDADRALLKWWLLFYQRSGAGLPDEERTQFVELSKQLTTLQNTYIRNYADDTTSIEIAKNETDGIPADFLASLKTAPDGKLVLPVNDSTTSVVYANAKNASVRKRMYFAYTNIQVPANLELLKKAIAVRYRLAKLLGYNSWAAYQMAIRTVTQPSKIDAFLSQLDAHLKQKAAADVAELAAIKAKETGVRIATIEPWDVSYYINELQKTRYSLDRNEVRQYFPAPHVVDAVLKIYQHLLGVTFTPVVPANNWNPDVTEFAVSDTGSGRFIGTFLLDLYPRDGKPGGAFNASILPVRRNADGSWRPPISAIVVSDWPAPLGGKPALLTHDDVTTFFHEFGHCMAALLTTAPYETLTQFGQDFVEAPSQMLENFTWDPTILKRLSSNVDTGAPIPDELIRKMIAARCTSDRLCNAYAATRQVMYSDIDLRYHEGKPVEDLTAIWIAVSKQDTPVPTPVGAHPPAQFTHLMGGYDAGVYVYLWSLVYAQDMFTAFQKGGIDNADVGMRYRKAILEPALIYGADKEVEDFLGRPMSPAAFYAGFDRANGS